MKKKISLSRLSKKNRANDQAWQKNEYEINMKVKRGELIWDKDANRGNGDFVPVEDI
jgi:hypothetical protein